MSSGDAKSYLSKRNVPGLFECLMTGLMFHRPSDHIQYLIDCLEKVKVKGQEELRWNMFIEMQRSKTPLPPITPTNGRRPLSRERSMTPKVGPDYFWIENHTIQEPRPNKEPVRDVIEEEAAPEHRTPTPLPPIGCIPDVPVVFVTGGPGSGASIQAQLLQKKQPGWVVVMMGELLRQEVRDRGTANTKWKMVNDLMSEGEMVPEDVVDAVLLTHMKSSPKAEGFIIHGFPRDMEQAQQFDKLVGRVDAVFLVDCEQETMSQRLLARAKETGRLDNNVNTVAKRIQTFRDKTLPVLKHYDDMDKLFVLEGEKKEQEIAEDLAIVFETVLGKGTLSPSPPKGPKPERKRSARGGVTTPQKVASPEPAPQKADSPAPAAAPEPDDVAPLSAHLLPPEVTVKDEGRKPDMPKAPIIFVAGGPGSGKGTQCKRLLARYTNAVHLSMGDILRTKITTEGSADQKWGMVTELLRKGDLAPEEVTVDLLTNALKSHPDAHFYLVEGFPRNLEQLEDFNKQIGGQSFTILLDCDEDILHYRLSMRGKDSERIDDNLVAIGKKLTFFKNNTLPILKTIEDSGKLVAVDGDRDEDEVTFDLSKILDFAIYGTLPETPGSKQEKEPVAEEVIEAAIVPASATTTGDNIANPSYTAELDATAEAKKADEQDAVKETNSSAAAAAATEDTKTEDTAKEASSTEQADAEKPKEEEKPEEGKSQSEETPKEEAATTEAAADADSSPKEDASKPAEPTSSEEAAKTEAAAESTEAAPSDEASKSEETKTEEAAKTGESAEAGEESKAAADSTPAGGDPEAPAQESAPASEEKKEEGETSTSEAAKEESGTAETAQ